MRIESDLALVLTASIDINAMPGVTRADPQQREDDYILTLAHYLSHEPRICKIIFLENSGWPLARLQYVEQQMPHHKQVEFVSLRCNDYPRHLGKGYGEMLMLEQGLAQSELAKTVTHFAKLTGRLRLANMMRILTAWRARRKHYDMLCDLRDHRLYQLLGMRGTAQRCDSRFFVIGRDFYNANLLGAYERCNDDVGIYMENVLYDVVKRAIAAPDYRMLRRFVTEPRYIGIPAHNATAYDSFAAKRKWCVRWLARKTMPWVCW